MNFIVHKCLPRHYAGKDRDLHNQFHLRRKVHVRTGSKQVSQIKWRTTNTFTAFNFANEMH